MAQTHHSSYTFGHHILPLIYFEASSRISYYQVENEAKRLVKILEDTEETRPVGGTARSYMFDSRSNGIGNLLNCIDVYCPVASTGMLVAIEEGKEDDFVNRVFQRFGYPQNETDPCMPFIQDSSSCYVQTNGKYWFSLGIDVADSFHHGAPSDSKDIKPKVWRVVSFSVRTNP